VGLGEAGRRIIITIVLVLVGVLSSLLLFLFSVCPREAVAVSHGVVMKLMDRALTVEELFIGFVVVALWGWSGIVDW
jgi:hypothetical protein